MKKTSIKQSHVQIIETGLTIRESGAKDTDAAYIARQFVQATLPHSDPKANTWSRKNGNFALGIQGGFDALTGKEYGLPYGVIPRLLLFWITTEAIRTKSRRLELGNSLAAFMRDVGLDPNTGGGKRGDAARLHEQMQRLFNARITFTQELEHGSEKGRAWRNMEVTSDAVLWWDTAKPLQGTLWNSWVELGEKLFEAIIAAPVPVDVRALKALKRSPLALDLYMLCCFEAYRVEKSGKVRFIPWRSLMEQLGAEYASETGARDFGVKARAALRKVQAVMPSLHLGDRKGGLCILPSSSPAIPALVDS